MRQEGLLHRYDLIAVAVGMREGTQPDVALDIPGGEVHEGFVEVVLRVL